MPATSGVFRIETIFLDLRPALLRYLIARGLAAADAEDLLQDQFIKLGSLKGPIDEPRAYLYRMTHNLLLDRRRSGARRLRRDSDWSDGGSGVVADLDERPSTEQILIAREQLASMLAAIAALPQRTGDIFRRYRFDGQTQKAIAADIGISKSAVEKHLYRAFEVMAAARAAFERTSDVTKQVPERHLNMRTGHDS